MNACRALAYLVLGFVWSGCQPNPVAIAPKTKSPAVAPTGVSSTDPNAWRSLVPPRGAPLPFDYPVTSRSYFASGLSLYSITRATPTQSLGIVCKAGSSYDPVGRSGTSGLVARMLSEGTVRLDGDALAIEVERLGANLRATSTDDALIVQLEVLPESAGPALELLSEVIQHPGFRANDFDRVRREWLDNITSEREDPSTLSALVARRALLGPSAGQSALGVPEEVQKLSTADLRAFHQMTVVPSRCAVLSAGPLSAAQAKNSVEAFMSTWKSTASRAPTTRTITSALPAPGFVPAKVAPVNLERRLPDWAQQSRVLFVERPGAVQTSIYLASSTPGRKIAGFEARHVISSYFGGIHTSRITSNLREKHAFTYGAYSRLTVNPDFGVWSIETDVKSEVTVLAIEQLLLERQKLVDGTAPGEGEVQRAKASMIQRNNSRLEHTNTLLSALQAEFSNELEPNYFATLGRLVEGLSPADLVAQVPTFAPPVSVLALVGPKEAVKDANGWFNAEIEHIDASWLDGM